MKHSLPTRRAADQTGLNRRPAVYKTAALPLSYTGNLERPAGLEPATPGFGGLCSIRSEEHTSELQSLMRTSYAVFCLKKKHTPERIASTNVITVPKDENPTRKRNHMCDHQL